MTNLEYFHSYDIYECDNLEVNEHNIYLYSFNKESESCVTIVNYSPFFMVELPLVNKFKWNSKNIKDLIVELKSVGYGRKRPLLDDNEYVGCTNFISRNIHGYLEGERMFLKIRFCTKRAMHSARERFSRAVIDFKGEHITFDVSESDLESVRQFTMERKLQYANWFSIPAGKEVTLEKKKVSRFKHEYKVNWDEVNFPAPNSPPIVEKWRVYPRIAAYDIEAKADSKKVFPSPFRPSNIAFMVSINYQQHAKPETRKRICIVYGDAKPPPDTIVYFCDSEAGVRKKFVELIAELEVDILAGHYNMGFDDWYQHQRNLNDWKEWEKIGSRLKDELPDYHDHSWSSNNTNKVDLKYVDFPGRITFDTKIITKANVLVRLPDYSLNTVSRHYLKKEKIDLTKAAQQVPDGSADKLKFSHEQIFDIYHRYQFIRKRLEEAIKETSDKDVPNGTGKHILIPHDNISPEVWKFLIEEYNKSLEEMGKLIDYCSEDSALVLDLLEKLNVWVNVVQAANIIQVRPKHVYTKGQQYKSLSQLYSLLKESTKTDPNGVVLNGSTVEVKDTSYEGALNLGMVYQRIGFTDNVASIDINSMYPSIVLGNNLCVSTEISTDCNKAEKNISHYTKKQYNRHDWTEKTTGDHYDLAFVTPDVHFGFFPRLVDRLLTERRKVKDSMKALAYNSFEYLIAEAIQNALKVSANSIYGMLGTNKNPKIPAKHIAALVTKIGRDTDIFMAQFIENGGDIRYPAGTPASEIPADISPVGTLPIGKIVYGDSVTGDTPILIRNISGMMRYVNIEDIPRSGKWVRRTLDGVSKWMAEVGGGIEVWSDKGFTPLKMLIKHYTKKDIYRILTHTGSVDVTADHSLLLPDGEETRPVDVEVGDELLHHYLPMITEENTKQWVELYAACPYSLGLFWGDGSCGKYGEGVKTKYTWAINNTNLNYLNKAKEELEKYYTHLKFKILDTMESSAAYKLVPTGGLRDITLEWRECMYNSRKQKFIPCQIMNGPIDIVQEFMAGYYDADGDSEYTRFDNKGAIGAAGLLYLSQRLGYSTSVNCRTDKLDVYRITLTKRGQRKNPNAIKKKWKLGPCNGFVYDLETENHHFAAGVGQLIVHNTDSVQFRIIGDYSVKDHIRFAKLYTDAINNSIAPLKIVLEKYGDMMVVTPKKYIFHFIDIEEKLKNGQPNPDFGNYLIKDAYKYTGVEFIKRNQPEVLKRLYKGITDGIMSESLKFAPKESSAEPVLSIDDKAEEHEIGRLQHIVDFTFTQLYKMIHNRNPIEDYIKYQQYTSDNGALGPLAARLVEIGKPIQIGERVPYVIVNYPGEKETRKTDRKKADKYRHFEAIGENDTIDIESYLKDLNKPIDNLICARYQGSKTYQQFFERKQVLKKVIALLLKHNLLPESVPLGTKDTKGLSTSKRPQFKTTDNLDQYILNCVLGNMKDPTIVNGSPIGSCYTELMDFKNSAEYKGVNRSVKSSLTRALKTTTSRGLTLGLGIPTLISNITLARNLGILDGYAKIMMSDAAFAVLQNM